MPMPQFLLETTYIYVLSCKMVNMLCVVMSWQQRNREPTLSHMSAAFIYWGVRFI